MSENAHLAEADPELAALLAKIPRPEPPSDIYARRKIFNEIALPKVQACLKSNAPDGASLFTSQYSQTLLSPTRVEVSRRGSQHSRLRLWTYQASMYYSYITRQY